MLIARVISPIHSLGPGERVGIWVQGCSKRCKGCISEELQVFDESKDIPVEILISIVKQEANRNKCERLTISGGDPFEQSKELLMFLEGVRGTFKDILVYTGFTFDEIKSSEYAEKCLCFIDVLIDGRYVEDENKGKSRLYGSNNQKVIFLNNSFLEDYEKYEEDDYSLETFIHKNKVITVGIQRRMP